MTIEYRSSVAIAADIQAAALSGDTRRLKELNRELQTAMSKNEQAEIDAANRMKAEKLNPVKADIQDLVESTSGLVDFIREMGGVLSFSYSLPAEDSTDGPVVAINASAKAAAKAPSASGSTGGSSNGGNHAGKMTDEYGIPLAALFDLIASQEDLDNLSKRAEAAKTDKSRNSAVWAVKSAAVKKAIEANDPRLPARKA